MPPEFQSEIASATRLLDDLEQDWTLTTDRIDWAAKRSLLDQFREAEGMTWRDAGMQALDLQYHLLDPEQGLFHALQAAGMTADSALDSVPRLPQTRAAARALAVTRFGEYLATATWSSLTFLIRGAERRVELPPDGDYELDWNSISDVECFVSILEEIHDRTK